MAKPYLSVVIPAYNEEKRIPTTLIDIDRHLSTKEYSYEIIVVVAPSSDRTVEVVKRHCEIIKNLRYIELDNKATGKGYAVKAGMLEAKGQYRVFTDADNSTTIDHFDRMLPYFKEGYGVVICSRAMKGSKLTPAQPLYRQIPGKIGNLIIQVLVLPGLWDTQCGFKGFSEDAARDIFERATITRWGFDVEVLALARKFGHRIKEIPVTWVNDLESKVTAGAFISTLGDVFKIRMNLWLGKYSNKHTQ